MNTTAHETPRVYAACLASYNNGVLHGEWLDATDADELREGIAAMLRGSKYPNVKVDCPDCDGAGCKECKDTGKVPSAEEWAFHDYDNFGGMALGESEDIDKLCKLGALIEEHGAAFVAYAGHVGVEWATEEDFQDAYCGEWDSERAYTEETFDGCNEIPDHLANYINYDSVAHDWFHCGDHYSVSNPDGGRFIFRST